MVDSMADLKAVWMVEQKVGLSVGNLVEKKVD